MTTDFPIPDDGKPWFEQLRQFALEFETEHRLTIGISEMAVGAGLISLAVHEGLITMGQQVVAHVVGGPATEALILGGAGATFGAIAAFVVKSIGVVGMGSAIGIPVGILALGASLFLGSVNYVLGDLIHHHLLHKVLHDIQGPATIATVGVMLLLDGARRVKNTEFYRRKYSSLKDETIRLCTIAREYIVDITRERLDTFRDNTVALIQFIKDVSKDLPDEIKFEETTAKAMLIGGTLGLFAKLWALLCATTKTLSMVGLFYCLLQLKLPTLFYVTLFVTGFIILWLLRRSKKRKR